MPCFAFTLGCTPTLHEHYKNVELIRGFTNPPYTKMHARDWFLVLMAVIFPPIPVAVKRGWSWDLALNILITLIFFVPGIIHALYVISKYPYQETYVPIGQEEAATNYGSTSAA